MPVEHEGKEAGYPWSLTKAAQKVMRTELRSLKVLIIAIVCSLNLAYIHTRLEELFGGNYWFGERNVLFVGDCSSCSQLWKPSTVNPRSQMLTIVIERMG